MNRFFQLQKFIQYQWKAKSKYYLHSPFVYSLYMNLLDQNEDKELQPIHLLREALRKDTSAIDFKELGTGKPGTRKLSDIEKNVAIREKYGALLYRLARHFQPKNIIEIGTSIGLSSIYMALAVPNSNIVSLEGSRAVIDIAKKNHATLGINNISIVEGNFDDTLSQVLRELPTLDLVFFDGNHTREATLRYFSLCLEDANENSIFIFDDIYRSPEMNEAWNKIKRNDRVTLTIDLFQWGICFFKREKLAKEDFILRY